MPVKNTPIVQAKFLSEAFEVVVDVLPSIKQALLLSSHSAVTMAAVAGATVLAEIVLCGTTLTGTAVIVGAGVVTTRLTGPERIV